MKPRILHSASRAPAFAAAALALLAVSGCGGERPASGSVATDGGTLVIAAPSEAEALVPVLAISIAAKQVVDQIFDHLADIGPALESIGDAGFVPRIAKSWSWSTDSMAVTFNIDPRARWHDGRPVHAEDVTFSYELTRDPRVGSFIGPNLPPLDSMHVADSLTVTFHFSRRNSERFFSLVYNLSVMPRHLLASVDRTKIGESDFSQHPIGSGPFKFARWDRRQALQLDANLQYHLGRPRLDRVIWAMSGDLGNAGTRTLAGEADFVEQVRPEVMTQLASKPDLRAVPYRGFDNGYLLLNERDPKRRGAPHPLFGDRELRRAIAMSIDRAVVVRNALDSLGAVSYGPFVRAQFSADTTIPQIPFDRAGAMRLLDSLGWRDANGDGVRERGGLPLRFRFGVPSVSVTRRRMAVVMQDQLKQVGVDARVEELEPAVLFPAMAKGDFDAVLHVMSSDPSPLNTVAQQFASGDPSQTSNYGSYVNRHVDSALAMIAVEQNASRAKVLLRDVYGTIIQDVPAVFMYEAVKYAAVHRRFHFETLRGDAWWTGIWRWYIPAAERIDRDKVPLAK